MNFSIKQKKKKKKRKILKFKEFCFSNIISEKFLQIVQNFAGTLSFLSLSFLFLLNKIPFKKLYCQCYLFKSVSELESCGTVNGILKTPKNMTQLNIKLGSDKY